MSYSEIMYYINDVTPEVDTSDGRQEPRYLDAYRNMFTESLWLMSYDAIEDTKKSIHDILQPFVCGLPKSELVLIDAGSKTFLGKINNRVFIDESEIIALLESSGYKQIQAVDIARVLVYGNPNILDDFSLKQKLAIICYLMGKPRSDIDKDLDIPKTDRHCIDILWDKIVALFH